MDLLQLRYFRMVAREENISRVAEQLRVAQPSLSRTITRLENELGVPLFDRQGRRIQLNRFGAAFLTRVERALGELDDARQELTDLAGLDRGSVAIAAENVTTIREVVAEFLHAHPGVRVRLFQSTAAVMAERLTAGEIDFGVLSLPPAPGLSTLALMDEQVLLGVSLDHPLASRRSVTLAEMAAQPFLTTGPEYWQRILLEHLCAKVCRRPIIACEGDDPTALRALVTTGLGVVLVPTMARSIAGPEIAGLTIDDPDARRLLRITWREDAYLSVAAQRFREMAIDHFARRASTEKGAGAEKH